MCWPNEIEDAMKDEKTQRDDLNESELLIEASDEALETAAWLRPQNGGSFTIAKCADRAIFTVARTLLFE
jgi:hypothetical protein